MNEWKNERKKESLKKMKIGINKMNERINEWMNE